VSGTKCYVYLGPLIGQFKIKYDKRSQQGVNHGFYPPYAPPDRDRYMNILQRELRKHLRVAHPDDD
jgi:hypothetical protein